MKKTLSIALAITAIAVYVTPVSTFAATVQTKTVTAKPAVPAGHQKFLSDVDKMVRTKTFRLASSKALISLSNAMKSGKYSDAYDMLSDYEKKVLADRYGMSSADDFTESVGPAGLAYKFALADIAKGKLVKFSSNSLSLVRSPQSGDIVTDGSGAIVGVYVMVKAPGAVFSDSKEWTWDTNSGWMSIFTMFIDVKGNIYPSYPGPIRMITQGTGIDVIERFIGLPGRTGIAVGNTAKKAVSGNPKLLGGLVGDIYIVVKDAYWKTVGGGKYDQDKMYHNNFKTLDLNVKLESGKEYSIGIYETYLNAESKARQVVKFRY